MFCDPRATIQLSAQRHMSSFAVSVSIVVCLGSKKQMRRIHAARHIALMQNVHPDWDWPNEFFVGNAMRVDFSFICPEAPIPFVVERTSPHPATIGALKMKFEFI